MRCAHPSGKWGTGPSASLGHFHPALLGYSALHSSVQPSQTTLQPHIPTPRQVWNSSHPNYLLLKAVNCVGHRNLRAAQTPRLCPWPSTAAATSGVCCAGAAIPGQPLLCCLCSQAINSLPKIYHYPGGDAVGMVRLIWSAEEQLKDGAALGCSAFPLSFVLFLI